MSLKLINKIIIFKSNVRKKNNQDKYNKIHKKLQFNMKKENKNNKNNFNNYIKIL